MTNFKVGDKIVLTSNSRIGYIMLTMTDGTFLVNFPATSNEHEAEHWYPAHLLHR